MRCCLPVFAICLLFAGTLPAETLLSTIAEIRTACANRQVGCNFDVTGQVVVPPSLPRLPVQLITHEGVFHFYDTRTNRTFRPIIGDFVRVTGITQPSGDGMTSNPNGFRIDFLSRGELPVPDPVRVDDYLAGDHVGRLVSVRGILADVHADDLDPLSYYVVLEGNGQSICLSVYGAPTTISDFYPLRGFDVIATGVGGEQRTVPRYLGKTLQIAGTNALRVVSHAKSGQADIPEADPSEDPRSRSKGGLRKVTGVVLARWHHDTILLRTLHCGIVKAELSTPPLPENGMSVEVTGTPETDLFDVILARAFWRKAAGDVPAANRPEPTSVKRLFTTRKGHPTIRTAEHGKLLKTKGVVKSVLDGGRFVLSEGSETLLVDCSDLPEALSGFQEQSHVEVTGVCVRDSETCRPSAVFPRVRGLFLVPRTQDDVRLLARPPWWTPGRLLYAVALLLVIIVAILIWNAVLRAIVVRKSRALLREQAERLSETLRIGERTRLAAELHDYHSQNLTAIAYQISAARKVCPSNAAEALRRLTAAIRMLKSARTDLRRSLWDLRNDTLNEPDFACAIQRTVQPVVGTAVLSVRFAGLRTQISDSTAHTLLSVLRELAANAANHGKATRIRIAGECRQQVLRFSISDDGTGFDPATRARQTDGHFGLDGVIERMSRAGGTVEITSAPGKGTYIRLVITRTPSAQPS